MVINMQNKNKTKRKTNAQLQAELAAVLVQHAAQKAELTLQQAELNAAQELNANQAAELKAAELKAAELTKQANKPKPNANKNAAAAAFVTKVTELIVGLKGKFTQQAGASTLQANTDFGPMYLVANCSNMANPRPATWQNPCVGTTQLFIPSPTVRAIQQQAGMAVNANGWQANGIVACSFGPKPATHIVSLAARPEFAGVGTQNFVAAQGAPSIQPQRGRLTCLVLSPTAELLAELTAPAAAAAELTPQPELT
jgi:hypothetical protein